MPAEPLRVRLEQAGPIPLAATLECGADEILVIVGPSGSGKTTLLRAISGLYTPKSGQVVCNGTTWLDTQAKICLPPQRRPLGMVFQHYALFPHLTARQNVMIALAGGSAKDKRTRAEALLQAAHIGGLDERYPHQLSGGQQQRVALARALARDPEALLLDEPFSAIDQQTRRKLLRELVALKRRLRRPIIHVTHDLNEARRIGDKLCIVHRGKTLQTGAPDEVMNRPADAQTAHLAGHYNVYACQVLWHNHEEKKTWIQWDGHALETRYRPEFAPKTEADWVIPPENVILHRRDRPSQGERENPVQGRIVEFTPLGETTWMALTLDENKLLHLSTPTHVARRNQLDEGVDITVSLLAEGIHLMEKKPRS